MKKIIGIDLIIMAAAPLLSIILAVINVYCGITPIADPISPLLIRYSLAPLIWILYTGNEAVILWILPVILLALMLFYGFQNRKKTSWFFASLFTVCWLIIVQLFIYADAMGRC